MINFIRNWLDKARAKRLERLYLLGYQYASTELVKTFGAATPTLIEQADSTLDPNQFDSGVLDAVHHYNTFRTANTK